MSSAGLRTTYTEQRTTLQTGMACTVTRTAVVGGKRRLRLGFVFPTEKGSTPSVLAVLVFWFCVCGYSPGFCHHHGLLASARSA